MAKQFILFDPVTAERKKMTLDLIAGIAGRTLSGLRYALKHRSKIRSLNCYILDVDTPIGVFRELLAKEVIPDEVWRNIPNSLWQVSSYGRYRSKVKCQDKIVYRLPDMTKKRGGLRINIHVDGKVQSLKAHKKVVELFIGEVPEGHIIYHKNGNKANNHVDNLGFITKQAFLYREATSLLKKPVVQMDEKTGVIVEEYPSLIEAAKANFADESTIQRAIKQNRPAIGFIWKWEEQVVDELLYAD